MSKEPNALEEAIRHLEEANEEIKKRSGRDLISAILIGVAIGAVILLAIIYAPWTMIFIAAVGGTFAYIEYARVLKRVGIHISLVLGVALVVALAVSGYFINIQWIVISWVAAVLLVALATAVSYRLHEKEDSSNLWKSVVSSVFLVSYLGLCLALAMDLTSQEAGGWKLLASVIIVVSVDTGAYAFGITRGKTPFAPKISPKKTWEGFLGGAVAALIAGVLLALFMLDKSWWFGIILAVALLVTATLGDLTESVFKRQLGVKDMSSWLPGHGGFSDRLDSILPSVAGAWVIFQLVI